MLKYLQDSKEQTGNEIKKVAIFTDKAAIGQELIRCVNLFAPDYGLDVVAEVDYSSNATDLSSQVLALKQADPDAILCDSYIGDATLFVQTLKEQNYKPKMIVQRQTASPILPSSRTWAHPQTAWLLLSSSTPI